MKEKKVRNRFLQVVSYILRGLSFIGYAAVVIMVILRTLAHFYPDLKDPDGTPVKVILEAPEVANVAELFTIFILPLLVISYIMGTMGKLCANVSRDIIFERKNVSYLRGMTLITFILSFVISDQGIVDGTVILLSLTLFLFSIILSRAITIAEEQEFTI